MKQMHHLNRLYWEKGDEIKQDDNTFVVTTNRGTQHRSKVIAIAAGLGY